MSSTQLVDRGLASFFRGHSGRNSRNKYGTYRNRWAPIGYYHYSTWLVKPYLPPAHANWLWSHRPREFCLAGCPAFLVNGDPSSSVSTAVRMRAILHKLSNLGYHSSVTLQYMEGKRTKHMDVGGTFWWSQNHSFILGIRRSQYEKLIGKKTSELTQARKLLNPTKDRVVSIGVHENLIFYLDRPRLETMFWSQFPKDLKRPRVFPLVKDRMTVVPPRYYHKV